MYFSGIIKIKKITNGILIEDDDEVNFFKNMNEAIEYLTEIYGE